MSISNFESFDPADRYVNEALKQNVPAMLYHATYKSLLPSIKKGGLDTRKSALAWEDSKPGIVYLANDPSVAESYAESAEEVSDEIYDSGIVVLEIPVKGLTIGKLHDDRNVQGGNSNTYEYHGQIPWSKIKKATVKVSESVNEAAIDGDRQMITRAIENMTSGRLKVKDIITEIGRAIDQAKISSIMKQNLKFNLKVSESVNEADKHEFNPGETAERLKRREQQNIERYRAAQEREDNYGTTYYKYRIAIDKIDLQKLKLMTQIHQLKIKYKK